MKLTRKVFAATMIVALLVMLLPQVALATDPLPIPNNWDICPAGTSTARWDNINGTWGWVGGLNYGITVTMCDGDCTGETFVYGSWTTSGNPVVNIVFKDGVVQPEDDPLFGYVNVTTGVTSGSFDFRGDPPTGQDIPLLTFIPTGVTYNDWPANKGISHIDFCVSQTAVNLDLFSASSAAGQVKLAWKTASETNNAGFNLYRATSLDGGQLVQVNRRLIAASMEAVDGASYSFVDKPGAGTFYYWLEDVDTAGATVRHGPVKVSVKALLRRPVYRPFGPAN